MSEKRGWTEGFESPAGVWTAVVRSLSHDLDRAQVFREICESGLTTPSYVMMSVLSAAIATLGLLLSSPAVVIGAMLLSPLMGPIILLGFAFWAVDWSATRRAIVSLAVGLGVSLAVALLLTWASPLKEPTAEILARTRPNLFDLLVAAFSGIAGGYAVIRRQGETVIGVAIATALMPPVATVGFGIGTHAWPIALGALLLLTTNLVAIALAAAGMAALHGFRAHYRPQNQGWIGHAAVIGIVIALCVPLTLSLNTIALESRATVSVRRGIDEIFGQRSRLTYLQVRSHGGILQVNGLVATPTYVPSASGRIARRLEAAVGVTTSVNLDQVVLADPRKLAVTAPAPISAPDPMQVASDALRDAVPFPTKALAYDPGRHRGVVLLDPSSGLDLVAAMTLENGLNAREGTKGAIVIPPLRPLSRVGLALPKGAPPTLDANLATDLWALRRWEVQDVTVAICGLSRRDRRWPQVRETITAALKPFDVTITSGDRATCGSPGPSKAWLVLAPA